MHGLLTAKVTAKAGVTATAKAGVTVSRRILSLAAAVGLPVLMISAVLALAGPAPAAQARTGTGRVSIAITSMNPQFAGPGATVTVDGTISNGTGQTAAGLAVQLYTSPSRFSTRDGDIRTLGATLQHNSPQSSLQ